MKTILYFFPASLLLLLGITLNAQKIDREYLGQYAYTQPPKNPVLIHYNSYAIDAMGAYSDAYKRDEIVHNFNLAGYNKVDIEQQSDFVIKIEEYPYRYSEVEKESKTEKYKVDGVEKTRILYAYVQAVDFKYVLTVRDDNGEKIYGYEYAGTDRIAGDYHSSSKEAYGNYKAELKKYKSGLTSSKISTLNTKVNNIVGFPVKSLAIRTGTVKAKKYKYDDYYKAFESFKSGLASVIESEENLDVAATSFNQAINGFETILSESDLENKKARINKKVTVAAYLNIGLSYFMLKDYVKASEYLEKAQEIDQSFGSLRICASISKDMIKRVQVFEEASQN